MSKYMHTIGGRPGQYHSGTQICYAGSRALKLADSLKQIQSEQLKSRVWRTNRGYGKLNEYGYVLVAVPA